MDRVLKLSEVAGYKEYHYTAERVMESMCTEEEPGMKSSNKAFSSADQC